MKVEKDETAQLICDVDSKPAVKDVKWTRNGRYIDTAFKHIILLAVAFDGNNQLIILAFAIVAIEDADNWVWFKECLETDLPGCRAQTLVATRECFCGCAAAL